MTKHLQLPHAPVNRSKNFAQKVTSESVVIYQNCSSENLVQMSTDHFLFVCLFVCLFLFLFVFSLLMSVPSKWPTTLLKSSKMEQMKPLLMVLLATLQQPWERWCCFEYLHSWWSIQSMCSPSLRQQLQEACPSQPTSVSPKCSIIHSSWLYCYLSAQTVGSACFTNNNLLLWQWIQTVIN